MAYSFKPFASTVFALVLVATSQRVEADPQWTIIDPSTQGGVTLASGVTGAAELSGIAWVGGEQYYVVGDNDAILYPLTIALSPTAGTIASATLGSGLTLSAGSDLEGLAYSPEHGSVLTSDETGATIREHSVIDGSLLATAAVPPIFSSYRANLSLESLSREEGGAALWTANEEALSVDGPVSSFTTGTWVRLQKFDSDLQPNGQWAYQTDPINGDLGSPGRDTEQSGVSDLVALPNGGLLVLERALGASFLRHRIYEVDFDGATDTSALSALDGAPFTPVTKHLLWTQSSVLTNYEGIALGPQLANGVRSLILVSDDGGGLPQQLQALLLLPNTPACTAEPRGTCSPSGKARIDLRSRGGTRDQLSFSWRSGTIADLTPFGEPTIALGNGFALCVYDTTAEVPQLRMQLSVPRGGLWSAKNGTSLAYKDRDGTSSGVASVKLRTGTSTAQLQVKAKGSAVGVPSPPPVGNLLSRDSEVIVQFVNRDAPGSCYEATFAAATREAADRFKASF